MPLYRDRNARGGPDDLVVIEDATVVCYDERGYRQPTYEFVEQNRIRAHPLMVGILLADAERLWTLDELLQ